MSTALDINAYLYSALEALPDHEVGEIIAGELHVSPRPAARHAKAAFDLGLELGGPFQRGRGGPGGWRFLMEPELHLADEVLVPDVAAWRIARMPEVPDTPAIEIAPDWVCEILSPSNRRYDRTVKMSSYARHGVEHLWLVDPIDRTLEVYRLAPDSGLWVLLSTHIDDESVYAQPFEAAPFELGLLWIHPS
jgi:Uma2 family endonuclease